MAVSDRFIVAFQIVGSNYGRRMRSRVSPAGYT
jgi:hypothetical protein